LGMSEEDVTAALQDGQSLADIADAQGVDVQKVIDAIVAADTAEIQAKVDDGTITQDQADQRLANLTDHVTNEVNGVRPAGMPGGPDGQGGPGGPGGPGRHGQPPAPPATDGTDSSTPTTTNTSTGTTS
jgi:hypothetical protein